MYQILNANNFFNIDRRMMKLVAFERTDFKVLFQYKFSWRKFEWRLSRPENRTSLPLHLDKVTVWCGLNSTKVFWPAAIHASAIVPGTQ